MMLASSTMGITTEKCVARGFFFRCSPRARQLRSTWLPHAQHRALTHDVRLAG